MSAADKSAGPEITFTAFVLGLSTAALQHLGAGPGGEDEDEEQTNLPMAQQTIDILAMLQEKTRGNLNEDEGKLLGNILYDLRMRYVEKTR